MKTLKTTSLWLLPLAFISCQKKTEQIIRPNVLFICVDDLRTEIGAYNHGLAKTPNMDRLANKGSLFFNQFVQIPTSGASRASMLTGKLPEDFIDISNEACHLKISNQPEQKTPETFIHQLKRNGYYTVGIGKVSHYADGYLYKYTESKSDKRELPYSWNELLFDAGKWKTGWNAFFAYANGENRQSMHKKVKPYECADVPDTGYPDGLTANLTLKKMADLAKKEQPFFLAVGFFKPHLPFNAPKKYWDLYDEKEIPITSMKGIPIGTNKASLQASGEFNAYLMGEEKAAIEKAVSDDYARKLRHAHLACISYTDAQIGKLLDELDRLGLSDNTIIVLWGDHGWHLGDLNIWGKHTIFDCALNSTFIMKVPGKKQGVKNHRVVSAVDIYPTLMELCNVKTDYPLDGHSFVKLLDDPTDKSWNDCAFSYFRRGISMRTPEFRYTKYFRKEKPVEELYRYDNKKHIEHENIANKYPHVLEAMRTKWEKGNTGIFQKK